MTKPPKPSLTNMLQSKGLGPMPTTVVPKMPTKTVEEAEAPVPESRMRVVVRLNVEAVEALEDITRELRRQYGKAVPTQKLMEEAVEDLLRKYNRPAVVLPAPAKRGK